MRWVRSRLLASLPRPRSRVHIRNRWLLEVCCTRRDGRLRTTRYRTMTGAGRKGPYRVQSRLGRSAIYIHILLGGELHNRIHDLVGDPPQHVPVVACRGVGAEVQWLADPDLRSSHGGNLEEPRRDKLGVDHSDWDYRHTGLQDDPGHPRFALVEAAVWRPCSFRIDAEQVPRAQYPKHTFHAGRARSTTGAVHRELTDPSEEPGQDPAAKASTMEQLDLGGKGEPALDHGG